MLTIVETGTVRACTDAAVKAKDTKVENNMIGKTGEYCRILRIRCVHRSAFIAMSFPLTGEDQSRVCGAHPSRIRYEQRKIDSSYQF
jgi:hypothetical protein